MGDQYTDLDPDTVQAAFVNTTDGELSSGDYHVLDDPQRIFGWGNVVPVVTPRLANEGPAFAETWSESIAISPRCRSCASSTTLAVDAANRIPHDVATQFLQTHGLIPASS